MFQWLKLLKAGDPMGEMLVEFQKMIETSAWMYDQAIGVLEGTIKSEEIHDLLYKRDKKVNKAQRRIRKQIVRHLTAQPESDMPACLAMMSVIKDAERLGDFSKNLLEVSEHYNGSFTEGKYITTFRQRFQEIREMFDKSCKAFVECDEEAAHEVVALKNIVSKECDEILFKLFDEDLPTNHAVAFTLMSRYIKRIATHLYNIASAVIEPVHKIDYADE